MKKVILAVFVIILCFCGCSDDKEKSSNDVISYLQAKELIINEGAILIDVRTKEEYDEAHIDGALSLPVDEIDEDTVKEIISSKDNVIIVYCRSGTRSKEAAIKIANLGYTNVYDFGSMSNWEE